MRKIITPNINSHTYKTKAEAVLSMLNAGYTTKQIRERMAVSYSYIASLKKQMAHKDDTLELTEDMKETLHDITRGRQARKTIGTMERKVPGGPATVVRATTEDRIDKILDERGSNYGSFLGLSQVTQRLKAVAHQFAGQHNKTFDADQAEALDLIFTKIGRILNGDPNHVDSWLDIAGYAKLVSDRLEGKTR
jgi:pyrroloquinoline quinone (PQQ) biosynthesis protein C